MLGGGESDGQLILSKREVRTCRGRGELDEEWGMHRCFGVVSLGSSGVKLMERPQRGGGRAAGSVVRAHLGRREKELEVGGVVRPDAAALRNRCGR